MSSMKIDQMESVIKAMANADSYHDTVKSIYGKIAAEFANLMDNEIQAVVKKEDILRNLEQEFIDLVSFIDKRNRTEADLLCILFGKKQAMRRANMYRFDLVDFNNRLLDNTRESDAELADKDQDLGTFTDTRSPYFKRMFPNGF